MKKSLIYWVMTATLLLVAGCQDGDECDSVAFNQDGDEILIAETDTMLFEPEDFGSIVQDGRLASEENWNNMGTATNVYRMVVFLLNKLFSNVIDAQVPVLDKKFDAEAGVSGQNERCWQMESHGFTYHSKSARGENVVLSGRVTFPVHKTKGIGHQVKAMTLNMHQALPTPNSEPSLILDLWTLRAYFDEAIIEPDGQGFGVNKDKDYYCLISPDVLARQMADCTSAALEVMRRHGITLAESGQTICTSCSMGAAVPLAFARYYETEASASFRRAVRLSTVYTGYGPVDVESCIRYFSDHPKFNAMLSKSMVFSLAALSPEQLHGYDAKDFVNPTMLETQVEYEGRTMSYYEIEARYYPNVLGTNKDMPNPKKLSEIIAPDMLTANGQLDGTNPKTQTLLRIMAEQNNWSGWLPTTPIYLLHGKQDDGIPVEQARKCYETLSSGGMIANVHYKEKSILPILAQLAQLPKVGLMHLISTLSFMNIYLKEDPKEAIE